MRSGKADNDMAAEMTSTADSLRTTHGGVFRGDGCDECFGSQNGVYGGMAPKLGVRLKGRPRGDRLGWQWPLPLRSSLHST